MTRDEAIVQMRRDLGFNSNIDVAILIDALKSAQVSLEREPELPFFLTSEITELTTVSGDEELDLPTGFLTLAENDNLWLFDSTADTPWKELPKADYDALRRKHAASDDAEPEAYSLDNLYFRLFPTPDAVYTLKMTYMKKDEVLDTNIENKWLEFFPTLMISLGIKRVSKATRDKDAYQLAQADETVERRSEEHTLNYSH